VTNTEGAVSRFTIRGTYLMADANYIDDGRRKGVRGRVSICGRATYQEGESQMARKLTIVLGVLAMVMLMTALPALAYGYDSGTVSCANKIAVHSRTTWDAYVQVPSGSTVHRWDDASTPVEHTWASQVYGPNTWRVLSTQGTVYAADTYAYCWGT
jgi:hypothetical protein